MARMVEGTHVGFLQKFTGNRSQKTTNRMWETPADEEVLRTVGVNTAATYIGFRQGKVVQRVSLRPIFKVYAQEQVFEGGGLRRIPWLRQDSQEEVLRSSLVEASQEENMRMERKDPEEVTASGGGML